MSDFFDRAGDLFNKAKCATGFHKGIWYYQQDGDCQSKQICERCEHVSYKEIHEWDMWRRSTPACRRVAECKRCHATKEEYLHVYGASYYPQENSCQTAKRCNSCDVTVRGAIEHRWGGYSYSQKLDSKVRVCERCGELETVS